ncbi:MAG: leucine-rich repeat domain-containing protein [Bacteroidales bacterium]
MKKFSFFFLAVFSLMLLSCGGESDGPGPEVVDPELSVLGAPEDYMAKPVPGLLRFRVKANREWVVTISEDAKYWISSDITEGVASDEEQPVVLSFDRNIEETQSRSGMVNISLKNDPSKSVTINISQKSEYLFVQDSLALVEIRNALNGDNWNKKWDLSTNVSSWVGVGMSEIQDVRRVVTVWFAASNNVEGEFPKAFSKLSALGGIQFVNESKLTGSIPNELGGLKMFEKLFLTNCAVGGAIPGALKNCPLLDAIAIEGCEFTSIDDEVGEIPSLIGFTVNGCKLEGNLSEQNWYKKMTNVVLLDISGNNLEGIFPETFLNGKSGLISLAFNGNRFVGDFPEALAAKKPLMENSESAINICPQQEGYGFTAGTCPEYSDSSL